MKIFSCKSCLTTASHTLTVDEMPKHSHEGTIGNFTTEANKPSSWGSDFKKAPKPYSYGAINGSTSYTNASSTTARPIVQFGGTVSETLYGSASSLNSNTLATGGGKAHNNLPPYLAVYCWKRTA